MSWDVLFAGQFEYPAHPAVRIRELAQALSGPGLIGDLLRVSVMDGRRGIRPVLELSVEALQCQRLEPSLLQMELSKFQRDDIAIEGAWEVMRMWPGEGEVGPKLDGYLLAITAIGNAFHWPQLNALSADLGMYAGPMKYFSPSVRGKMALDNIEALLGELAQLVRCGVRTLRGLDADRSEDPATAFLCFHRSLASFATDLALPTPPTLDEIQAAADKCDQIGVQSIDGGAMVFHRSLVDGNLQEFYQQLRR